MDIVYLLLLGLLSTAAWGYLRLCARLEERK